MFGGNNHRSSSDNSSNRLLVNGHENDWNSSPMGSPMASPALPSLPTKYSNVIGASPHHGEAHVEQRSPLSKVFFNMVNSIVGAGIVGLPMVFAQSGLALGLGVLAVLVVLTDHTLGLLIKAARLASARDYEDLCEAAFGDFGYYLVSGSMFIMDYGAMLTYLLILADSSVVVYRRFFGGHVGDGIRACLILGISCVLILPLCLPRDVSGLERASSISVLTVVVIISIVVYLYFAGDYTSGEDIQLVNTHFLSGIGTLAFAFVCHDCAFLFYQTLDKPSTKRWGKLTFRSLTTSAIINIILAVCGYLTFRSETKSNILNNYRDKDNLAMIARALYILTMCLTYPIGLQVTRHVIYAVVFRGDEYISEKNSSPKIHYCITFLLFFTSIGIACVVKDLGVVMSLTGSVAACILAFILPPACYLKLCLYNPFFWQEPQPMVHFKETWLASSIFILGVLLSVLSTVQTILDQIGIDYGL